MRYVHQRISPSICRTMLTNQCPIEVFADKLRRRSAEAQSAARRTETSLSERQVIDIDNRCAETLAKEMGLWLDFSEIGNLGDPAPSGMENEVYLSNDGSTAFKVNNLMLSRCVSQLLDRLILHNAYFPQTRYDLYGFTGFGHGSIYPIIMQQYIKEVVHATPDEIERYMNQLGFANSGDARYSDGTIEIMDLRPRNVLTNKEGDMWVIDADFKVLD